MKFDLIILFGKVFHYFLGGFMMEKRNEISKLKDKERLKKFCVLVRQEKEATASVVSHLAEIDRRKLYAQEGYSSLFNYVTQKYHYSEGAAYRRIQAARLSFRFPEIMGLLKEGKINLMNLSLVAPHLNQNNKEKIFSNIFHKSTREAESVISSYLGKRKVIKDKIRILPSFAPKIAQNFTFSAESNEKKEKEKGNLSPKEPEGSLTIPLVLSTGSGTEAKEQRRVKIEFEASEILAEKIQRAKELLRHKYPQGKIEDILDEALELLLNKKDPQRKIQKKELAKEEVSQKESQTSLKMSSSLSDAETRTRYVPEKIKQDIYKRDEGQCSYVSPNGNPCGERNFLELDHIRPWSLGGESSEENLRLLCRTHNQWRSEKTFGKFTGPIANNFRYLCASKMHKECTCSPR